MNYLHHCAVLFISTLFLSANPQEEPQGYQIGLSMYSLHPLLESGELDALDYPAFAKEQFGISLIDVWDGGFPKSKRRDPEYYKSLKSNADAVGADIFLVMTGTIDARSKHAKALKKAGMARSHAVDEAIILDADYVRVFLKAADDVSDEEAIQRSSLALTPLADYAQSKGITIVIEPSTSQKTKSGAFLANLVNTLNHPNCKLMPDFGKLESKKILEGTIAMMPHTAVVSAKSYNFHADGSSRTFDYPQLMKAVNDANFTGIVAIEYEGKDLSPVEGVLATKRILNTLNRPQPRKAMHSPPK